MGSIIDRVRYNPSLLVGAIVSLAALVGVEVTEADIDGVLQIAVVVVPLVQAAVVRASTYSRAWIAEDTGRRPTVIGVNPP